MTGESECPPEDILSNLKRLQKRALSGYKVSPYVTEQRFSEALAPKHVAISLSGEPTLYSQLPELIRLLNAEDYTTFLVSNGTRPDVLRECRPFQLYVSLVAPDQATYQRICRPLEDSWENLKESLGVLDSQRSAIRITLVKDLNDSDPGGYARLIADSGADYIEVKGYMYLGYSRKRLQRSNMPEHAHVRQFAEQIAERSGYCIADENSLSRVVCMERES